MILPYIKTPISFALWFCISFIFTLLCIPLTFLPAPRRYENRFYFFLTTIWNKLLMLSSFVSVTIDGKENLPQYPDSPAIIAVNHTSALDIFLIEKVIGTYPHIWICKASYKKIPLFSILLKRMHVAVERDDARAAAFALLRAYKQAKKITSHIIMFPEGRRYADGNIHEFNRGLALLAQKLKRPIIPIKITGLHKIFPKGQLLIDCHAAKPMVTIGKPIYMNDGESTEGFTTRVREWFLSELRKQ